MVKKMKKEHKTEDKERIQNRRYDKIDNKL